MIDKDLLHEFPNKRIAPVDGLAVTAAVWAEAHDEHRQRQQFHNMLCHGPGIVAGLEVIASDPADSAVYIQPGLAIDPRGRMIVLNEPITYDLGTSTEGRLHLLLSYGESRPTVDRQAQPDGPLYVHTEFGLEVQIQATADRGVELARIRRQDRQSPIFDAQDPTHPGPNEIDLRFRRNVSPAPREMLSAAVCYVGGGKKSTRHGTGIDHLARAFARSGPQATLHVDHDVPLAPGLEGYALIYLVGQGAFKLGKDEMQALYDAVQAGTTILIESCRHETAEGDPPADESFYGLLSDLGVKLTELRSDHRLLRDPFVFATAPQGFETQGAPRLAVSDAVIFSTHDYGCLWQGEQRGGSATRETIRTALEWGCNIVAYAVERHRRAQGQ